MIDAVTYGMIPSAKSENRESAEPEKRFKQREDAAAAEEVLQRGLVDARRRHPGAEPVGGEDARSEEHPLAELRDAPCVREPAEHAYSSESGAASSTGVSFASVLAGLSGSSAASGFAAWWRTLRSFGSRSSSIVPPACSIFSRALAEIACTRIVSFIEISPLPSSFTSIFVFFSRPFSTSDSGVTSSPCGEALEIADVDVHRVGAERADRHRVLRRRAAQLADAHVDRHLAALEAGAHLVRARARLLALDAAAGVAALAGAGAAADALAVLPGLGRLEIGEVEFALRHG